MDNCNESAAPQSHDAKVKQIVDEIWKMMEKELREERERRGRDRK